MRFTNYKKYIHAEHVGNSLFFYLREKDSQHLLFIQRAYPGLLDAFRKDISVPQLLRQHKWGRNKMVDHVMRKLPRYITYVEQYAA